MQSDSEITAILERFGRDPERTWHPKEIAVALELRGKQLKHLEGQLRQAVAAGSIVELRPGVYGLGRPADLATGKLRMIRSGAGLVADGATGRTIWVGADDLGTALPDDTVTVRLQPAPTGDEPRGKVIRIVSRSPRDIVGTLCTTGKFLCVVPLNPVYRLNFYVPDARGARDGDRVVVRFTNWVNRHVAPEGEIVDVIGPADKPSLDTTVVMRQYDLSMEFPAEVIQEAEAVATRMQRPGPREDLSGTYIITIDPLKARDFDDAISLTFDAQGRRVLGVHIADVSHFVRPGGALDTEAYERGNSVYLVDKVIPMLPEQLSNGVCSLCPNEDRLTFSAFLTFDTTGRPVARRFARTRIHSRQRLTYEQAMAIMSDRQPEGLDAVPPQTRALLTDVRALARQLREGRFAKAALDLEVPECEVRIGPDGRMTGIAIVPHDESHTLIEECMVAANEAVAAELASRGVRIISRLHEAPDPDKLEELRANLAILGVKAPDLGDPRRMAKFLADTSDHPLCTHIHTLVLRSMKRALYASDATGHFGLAKQHYAHFTSPIRRYADLVLHRQLAGLVAGEAGHGAMTDDYLKRTAAQCTAREQVADEASRALIEIKKFRFLQQQLDDRKPVVYDAVVSRVTNFGLFVDVLAIQVSGLVHISSISDQFVRYNSASEALSAGSDIYRVGTRLRVIVARVDFDARRADFGLVREKGGAATSAPARGMSHADTRDRGRPARPSGPSGRPDRNAQQGGRPSARPSSQHRRPGGKHR